MPRALLSAQAPRSFKSRLSLSFELTAAPGVTLTCPSMPEGASPALVWPLGVSLFRLWSQQTHVYQAHFCQGFAPWTASALAKRTQQEHITRSREAIRKGLLFSQGAGCQIRSPTVWGLTLTEQFFQWNHLWSKEGSLKILSYHSAHTHTPQHISNCSGEEMPGDMRTKYKKN